MPISERVSATLAITTTKPAAAVSHHKDVERPDSGGCGVAGPGVVQSGRGYDSPAVGVAVRAVLATVGAGPG